MAILTNSGRVAMAQSVKAQPIHMAWGSGDAAWDTVPVPESISSTALQSLIGVRKAAYVQYCEPDVAGAIIVPTGRFTETVTPTKHLYMRFAFDFGDAPTSTIRELAVLVGTITDPILPIGQMYFTPAQVATLGTLLVIEHIQKFERSASVRQTFEFVVTF
jgi:hypothetical protein